MAQKKKFNDLGLGAKASAGKFRSLNKDGSFNVKKENVPFGERINFFHALISMPRLQFFGLIITSYFIANIVFACIYSIIGVEHLTSIEGLTPFERFMEAFFFSAQTITTLGYGRVAPIGMLANSIAAIESLLGLLTFALATGLLYGRFSKPSAQIKYSSNAVVAPYQDINGFMFRLVNPQKNQLLEVEATLTLSLKKQGSDLRDFYQLELERPKIVFFPSVWTIVHPINKESPLYALNEEDVLEKDAEFIVMIKAFDESFSQTVYSRSSYKANEIEWGVKFSSAIKQREQGITIDVAKLSKIIPATLNQQSIKDIC